MFQVRSVLSTILQKCIFVLWAIGKALHGIVVAVPRAATGKNWHAAILEVRYPDIIKHPCFGSVSIH